MSYDADLDLCYYCGQPATDLEHVIPRSVLRKLSGSPGVKQELIRGRVLTVRSCHECNMLVGASVQETLIERKEYLKDRLRKRYRKLLDTPDWTDEEIAELGDGLRRHIHAQETLKATIRARIAW